MTAKQKQDKTAHTLEVLQHNAAKKGASRIKNRTYAVVLEPENLDQIRLAPQAITCVGVILSSGKEEITEMELFNLLDENVEQFNSKQTPWKIFQYYKKPIMEAGFLKEVKAAE